MASSTSSFGNQESESRSNPNPNMINDVFISFCGKDTGGSFASALYTTLTDAGVFVYRHDDSIVRKDEQISVSVLKAIEASRISIIVFSRNYADSRWCMQEMEKIMECHKTKGQKVVPVFYGVNPFDVRNQRGMFGKAFENLMRRMLAEEDKVSSWRDAFDEACKISGFTVMDFGSESAKVKNIFEFVILLLDRTQLFIAKYPVGVESRAQDVIKLLDIEQSKNVLLLGIWGMGGIGKTTIAKAIYNTIRHSFEGASFLLNIRECWTQDPISLQKRVLSDIYKTTSVKIENIESGKNILRQRLALKKVLLVLDDVWELDQLNALCGSRNWFGPGSRIIITTRNIHLLRRQGAEKVYTMKELNQNESLELFSFHAFGQSSPTEEFVEHSRNVVEYSGGLPLALEVLGASLFLKKVTYWNSVSEKLGTIPNDAIQEKLRISFDELHNNEKKIFLDIACFFIGMDQNDVIHILNGRGYFAEIGISVLVERSLVTVDVHNKLGMLDLLRDMGREIIRMTSPFKLAKRSRLWFHKDVAEILSKDEGTDYLEGLSLKLPKEYAIRFNTRAFEKMKKLRLLQFDNVQFDGDFKYLPRKLTWLRWRGFPLKRIPAEFLLTHLAVIELKYSNLKQLWEKSQMLVNLKVLKLSHSQRLTTTPDFSYMPNLEKLVLKDCPNLFEVSHTIGSLNKLLLLNLRDCRGLQNLPRSIYTLKYLKTLILAGCSKIDKLEEDLEQMKSLTTLIANNTAITKVPFSILRLKYLEYISLCGYEGYSHDVIPSIDWSRMSPTNNLSSQFPIDVFLSFRGDDTRASFTSHLYASLQNAKINVFMDDHSLQMGDQISNSLLRAIENSRISIIIFSRNYTDSTWCLREMEKIIECHRTIGQVVLPVFYNVDPSEVRHQIGNFGEAFENLLKRISVEEEIVLSWKRAFREAAGISGIVLLNSRNENEDIKKIVEHVTHLLNRTELFIVDHPVGVESRVQDAIKLLNSQQSKDVLLLGICGMGGIGKTTIVKAIFNQIGGNFEGKSFLLNIREVWEQYTNRVSLQQQVLDDICKESTMKILNIESGKNILKERLTHKKVLLVLDDVDELDQLNALCGCSKWFGPGSRIIITTRDRHLLTVGSIDLEYEISEMDEVESLEHFCWHAFKQDGPKKDFAKCSKSIVDYCKGLPLALEVLGSYLFGRGISEWDSVLKRLNVNGKVQQKLRISFDGLNREEKEIFLDISCFFIGMDRNYVMQILNDCGFSAEIGIGVLVERSLVTIDNKNKLQMHNLLRDMGREIIREKSPNEPEEHSRLWNPKEVLDVLSKEKGTKAIQGLALKLENTTCLKTKAFKKMYNLRLLQLASVLLDGDYKHLSRDLRWLCWNGFPLSYIPAEFHQESLVAIELKYSNLKQIWTKGQMLENLKILNLSHSHNLTKTPDFSYLPNLEKLLLKDCPSLSMVSHTIECLNKLLLMNLKDCSRLHNLPRSIYKLKSLETMILSGCLMIDKLEEDLEQMESLTTLMADNTSITEVPFSIVKLKSIGYISLCGFEGFSRDVFPSIIQSWMLSTYNSISMVPKSAMSSLVALDVQCSSSYSTSSAFKDLPNLQSLFVECDSEYQLTCDVQSILDTLEAKNYKGLEASAATLQISDIKSSPLIECRRQVQISRSKNFLKSLLIQMGTKCEAPNISRDSTLQNVNRPGDSSLLLSDNYSDRLTFSCKGSSVEFELPQMNGFNLKSMMLFIVYSSPNNLTLESCQNVLIINYTKRTILVYKRDALISFKDEEWKSIRSNLEPGNKVKVIVLFGHGFMVEKTTVYLLNCEPIDKNMEHYHIKENCGTVSDMALDKSITVFGGNKLPADKNIIITGADGKGPDDGSISVQLNLPDEDVEDEEQPIPLRKRKASNYQIVQSSKQVKTSTEPTQCSSQEMNQERNQYVEVEYSTNPHIHPNHEQMQVEVNVNIFEHLSANLQSEENALPSENQPVDESRQIDPPHWISLQANNVDQEKEKSVETLQEVPKGINKLFDFEAMSQLINDDPLSALENMFSGEISVSSKTQQSITQVDISEVESSFVNQLLEDLKILLFNKQDMNDVLLRELDIEKVKFIFEKLSKVHDQLPAATRAFIFHSQKFYYEALTHKKNYVHGISRLSGYEHSKKEFAEKALKIKDNKTKLATLTASSQEKLHVFNTQIVALEKQLQDLKKQRDNLQQDITKCEEQKQNINIESENLARQTMSILTKIKETEDNVETASVGFEVSKAIFEKLKSKLPF